MTYALKLVDSRFFWLFEYKFGVAAVTIMCRFEYCRDSCYGQYYGRYQALMADSELLAASLLDRLSNEGKV